MAFPGETLAERAAATLEREPDLGALGELPQPITDLLRSMPGKDPKAPPLEGHFDRHRTHRPVSALFGDGARPLRRAASH